MSESEFLPATETTAHPAAVVLRKEVREVVETKTKAGEVRKRVVDQLVETEVARRANLLASVLAKRAEAAKELDKIRPDIIQYGEDGNVTVTAFSKPILEQRKQAKQKLEKIDTALDKAINEADYQGVEKLASSKEVDKTE